MSDDLDLELRALVASYSPNGDGTWDGSPCGTCGGHSFLLDDTPACLVCTVTVENWRTYFEAAVSSLDALVELAPKLPAGEAEKARLDLDFVNLTLARLALGVRR